MYVTEPVSDSLTRDCPQCKAKAGVRGAAAPVKGGAMPPAGPKQTKPRQTAVQRGVRGATPPVKGGSSAREPFHTAAILRSSARQGHVLQGAT